MVSAFQAEVAHLPVLFPLDRIHFETAEVLSIFLVEILKDRATCASCHTAISTFDVCEKDLRMANGLYSFFPCVAENVSDHPLGRLWSDLADDVAFCGGSAHHHPHHNLVGGRDCYASSHRHQPQRSEIYFDASAESTCLGLLHLMLRRGRTVASLEIFQDWRPF